MWLEPLHVEFDRLPIESRSPSGMPYIRWVRSGMPKLGQYTPILKTVFFLYPDEDSAKAGVKAGGTGFLIGVRLKDFPDRMVTHAVTNYHVAVFNKDAPPSPVIRINCLVGNPDIFNFDPSEWIFSAGGPDIAISPPLSVDQQLHDFMMFDPDGWLLTSEEEKTDEIGPGEDVFMLGRFVDYDGVETNQPAARFGHISMMDAKIIQSTGYRGRSIVLDMHSRSGFSGSPVIIYRTLGSHFLEGKPGTILTGAGHYIKMLGIHYAQFPEAWELKQKTNGDVLTQATLQADTHYIEGLSGMTCVIPAVEIRKLLYSPELERMRKEINDALLQKMGKSLPVKNESAAPPATDESPTHREDFMRLVGEAAQKRVQED